MKKAGKTAVVGSVAVVMMVLAAACGPGFAADGYGAAILDLQAKSGTAEVIKEDGSTEEPETTDHKGGIYNTSEQLSSVVAEVSAEAEAAEFRAAAYVDARLDLLTRGETAEYMKVAKCTEAEAVTDYKENIENMINAMNGLGISDGLLDGYRELYKNLYSNAQYEVKDAKKMEDGDSYMVTVEICPMTGIFTGLVEELSEEFGAQATADMPEEEQYELMYRLMLDKLNARLEAVEYMEAQTIEVEVISQDGTYEITGEGYARLDEALLDTQN